MLKALKIRLYPNATQTTQFNKLLGAIGLSIISAWKRKSILIRKIKHPNR